MAVQNRLFALGYLKSPADCDMQFGPHTADAVQRFQRDHNLTGDGIVGPITRAVLFPEYTRKQAEKINAFKASPLAEAVIRAGMRYVGIKETGGANRGPLIDRWNRECHVPEGSFWCMSAVQGVFAEGAADINIPDQLKPDSAGCFDLMNRVPKEWLIDHKDGQRGDIAIFTFSHCGIVLANNGNGTYDMWEGNTNNDGSRDGYMVCVKNGDHARKWNQIVKFIRVPCPEGVK